MHGNLHIVLRFVLLAIFCLFVLSCTSNQTTKERSSKDKNSINRMIETLGISHLVDCVMWRAYLIKGDDFPISFKHGNSYFQPVRRYSEFEIKVDSIYTNKDTVKIFVEFYVTDYLPLTPEYFPGLSMEGFGMMFYNSDDPYRYNYINRYSSLPFLSISGMSQEIYDTTSIRDINPLQPDVIKFLNENKTQLHPWLYKEGVKRGVIKE